MRNFEGIIAIVFAVLVIFYLITSFGAERACNANGGIMVKQQYGSVCVYGDFYGK